MKESEKSKQIRKDLDLLEQRVARLSEQIRSAMNELVVRQELRLVQQALDTLKEAYKV